MRRRHLPWLLATPALATPALAGDSLMALEAEAGGRLGVLAIDTASGRSIAHRADERFAMMSTFKALLAACVLARGPGLLERGFAIPGSNLLPWSPVTETRAGASMTGAELCAAILESSDNTAANLLLDATGGPAALTQWLRATGDGTTRLDRTEPLLNAAQPGDARDTTTPAAMVETLARLTLADTLPVESRARLLGWMAAHRYGGALLRAGMPGWTLADRSGAGGFNSRAAVAVAWPPTGAAPWVIAAYLHQGPGAMPARDALLARVGALIAAAA